ncbi:MAG: hypothetical protein ACTHK4_00410 [Mycobacteriales bacterium]
MRRNTTTRIAVVVCGTVLAGCSSSGTTDHSHDDGSRSTFLTPLADLRATPSGWSAVGFRAVQISVPDPWFIEGEGDVCGEHDPGRVYIGRAAEDPPPGMGCGPAQNVVSLQAAGTAPIPGARAHTADGVRVLVATVKRNGVTTYRERALGVDMTATGPLAGQVMRTVTHSTLSVVLRSTGLPTPAGWRHVTFGGLRFAVPSNWKTDRFSNWGGIGCAYNLMPDRLQLNTARRFIVSSCPAPLSDAQAGAGVLGMLIGAGPALRNTTVKVSTGECLVRSGLRICPLPEPLHGGYPDIDRAQILEAQVYRRGDSHPDFIQLGLGGSGLAAAEIFDSLAAAA